MPTNTLNRRALLRGAGAAGVVGLAAAGSMQTASADTGSWNSSCAFGTWQCVVKDPAGNLLDQGVQVAFQADGTLTGSSGSGHPVIGSWKPTGSNTFTFFAHEQLFNANGLFAIAHLLHNGTVSADGNSFQTSGTVTGVDLNGNQLFQESAAVFGTRFRFS